MTFSGASAALPSTVSKPILLRNITEHWWLSSTTLHFRELIWIMFAYECVKSIREQWCELEVRRRMRICRRRFCELDSFHKRIGRDLYQLLRFGDLPTTCQLHPISSVQQSSVMMSQAGGTRIVAAGTCRSDHWFHNQVPKLAVVSYVSKNRYITIYYSHIDTFTFKSYLSMISMSVMTFVPGLCWISLHAKTSAGHWGGGNRRWPAQPETQMGTSCLVFSIFHCYPLFAPVKQTCVFQSSARDWPCPG